MDSSLSLSGQLTFGSLTDTECRMTAAHWIALEVKKKHTTDYALITDILFKIGHVHL